MDDYRYQKRQKMRARRRRAQRIKMTGMCIATLIVFIFIAFPNRLRHFALTHIFSYNSVA